MSTYTALYRKWRPKVFEEVVGQPDLIQSLKNQIRIGSIGHAYLFSGTRGTGKTSTAKIFSRAINCLAPVESNPCNECEVCKGILDESLMDVVEIDAASNNGVDDIRELRENVKYPPSRSKYKVYIIDEVHMLSTGAFNALLKTLEEPPAYVVFILATTEPHKLPATILSRCQRFDFKRVNGGDLLMRLSHICDSNGVSWSEEALEMIIKKSDGAVRDSLSMLDQCLSSAEGELTTELVIKSLGLVQSEVIATLVDAIYNGKTLELFETIDRMISDGKNLNQFVKDLLDYERDLMMVASAGGAQKILKTNADFTTLERQAKAFGLTRILRDLAYLIELDHQLKWSTNARIQLEMTLVKLSQNESKVVYTESQEAVKQSRTENVDPSGKGVQSAAVQRNATVQNSSQPNTTASKSQVKPIEEAPALAEGVEAISGDADPKVIESKWQEIIQYLARNKKASVKALLVEGVFVGVSGKIVQVGYPELYGFHLNAIQKEENRTEVEKAIFAVTGYSVRAQFDFIDAFQSKKSKTDESKGLLEDLKDKLGEFASQLEVIE